MLKSFGTLQLQTMNGKFQPLNNDYTEENKILLFWVQGFWGFGGIW